MGQTAQNKQPCLQLWVSQSPFLGLSGRVGQQVLRGLGEGEGWLALGCEVLQAASLLGDASWPLVQPGEGGSHRAHTVKAWVASAHPRGGSREGLGGASSPAGCLGCSTQKQEALMGALVTGLM